MRLAIVKNDQVQNIIIGEASQADEFAAALSAEVLDAAPYGLQIGDLRTNSVWTRNVEGEQTALAPAQEETSVEERVTELEEALDLLLSGKTSDTATAAASATDTEGKTSES